MGIKSSLARGIAFPERAARSSRPARATNRVSGIGGKRNVQAGAGGASSPVEVAPRPCGSQRADASGRDRGAIARDIGAAFGYASLALKAINRACSRRQSLGCACMTHSFLIDEVGLWAQRLTSADFVGRPAVFLDRDGVIVEEVHFLAHRKDVRLTFGIGEAIAALNRISVAVVMVTNQSGIARGHFGWREFVMVQDEIAGQLARAGGVIDAAFACGYHQAGAGPLGIADHPWRKPRPGMFREAEALLGVDLRRSLVIGDRLSDLEAGFAAGVPRATIVRTGYGEGEADRLAEPEQEMAGLGVFSRYRRQRGAGDRAMGACARGHDDGAGRVNMRADLTTRAVGAGPDF